ncbi:hypothetical protein XELAEV_18033713mg [Xenopus laevis]|uniref:Uncharacterized protein n=1 Tax=Xenopus laevis TaxID=8355 RepID=A0A974CM42_XENLA|nr:hypothetical protein XELAEV_18033713mg [Xenopus laevis]
MFSGRCTQEEETECSCAGPFKPCSVLPSSVHTPLLRHTHYSNMWPGTVIGGSKQILRPDRAWLSLPAGRQGGVGGGDGTHPSLTNDQKDLNQEREVSLMPI